MSGFGDRRRIDLAPRAGVRGAARVPGSKSISNRALLLALLARGTSTIRGILRAEDTEAMTAAIGQLGAAVELDGTTAHVVGTAGAVAHGPRRVDAHQSGTTARFVAPVMCLGRGRYELDGDPQLRRRPMGPLLTALGALGAHVTAVGEADHLPVEIEAGWSAESVTVRADTSSQFLSALLLAAPCAPRPLTVTVEGDSVNAPFVEMTVAMARARGASIEQIDGTRFEITPTGYEPFELDVEPDATAASYFFAAAAVTGGSVVVPGLAVASSVQGDLGFVELLSAMGASVTSAGSRTEVSGTGSLRAIDVDLRDLSDVAPTLAVVAAVAEGTTVIRGVDYIRHHESDRIAVVASQLRRCGVDVVERDDGLEVTGGGAHGAVIDSHDDHRIAMAFAVLGLVTPGIEIDGASCVAKTFPEFWDQWEHLTRR